MMLKIKDSLDNNDKVDINTESLRISFKRTQNSDKADDTSCQSTQTDNGDIHILLSDVI